MKPQKVRELLPIITAFAEGKQIQLLCQGRWTDFNSFDFSCASSDYRIKPSPSPTLRPWRPEEVPVGALIRFSKNSSIQGKYLILASDKTGIVHCNTPDMSTPTLCKLTYEFILKFEHSLDHGKTWLPCGVMSE